MHAAYHRLIVRCDVENLEGIALPSEDPAQAMAGADVERLGALGRYPTQRRRALELL